VSGSGSDALFMGAIALAKEVRGRGGRKDQLAFGGALGD
jgi:hypothetical protein